MSEHIVVANSTPIILLEKVGQLGLLERLYSSVLIPEAVYAEVITEGEIKRGGHDYLSSNHCVKIAKVQNTEAKLLFSTNLHEGEVETILLAIEKSADLCILDDLVARKYAKNVGLVITGTLGVIIAAKNKGHIDAVKPIMNRLLDVGMHIGNELYSTVLAAAKED